MATAKKREVIERHRTLLETNLVLTPDLLRWLREKKTLPEFVFEEIQVSRTFRLHFFSEQRIESWKFHFSQIRNDFFLTIFCLKFQLTKRNNWTSRFSSILEKLITISIFRKLFMLISFEIARIFLKGRFESTWTSIIFIKCESVVLVTLVNHGT